jgi:hypothetical protein
VEIGAALKLKNQSKKQPDKQNNPDSQ